LVADFDPGRGDISWELGYHAQGGISELLDNSASAITPEVIAPLVVLHDSGIHLLLASQSPKQAVEIMQVEKFKAIASQLPFLAKWVIMDLGSHLVPATQSLARLCDDLIIVVAPNPVNISQTKALIDDLITLGIGEARIRAVLVNRIRSAVQLNWEQVENELGYKISTVFTPAPELAFQASIAHTPMVLQQPNNITAQQFEKLATTITSRVVR
jgi:MinD-like ATPase involved in chromosome partitioning or flagellar assembly